MKHENRNPKSKEPTMKSPILMIVMLLSCSPLLSDDSPVSFTRKEGRLQIDIADRPFGAYVWDDPKTLRPYFAHLHAPNGVQVTRRHPPVEGEDPTDHAEMHPGLWLAFGDVSGADFWRNKGIVEHVEFVEEPVATTKGGRFAVKNRYLSNGRTFCEELCRIKIEVPPGGYLIDWTSEFSGSEEFYFGDQEEMGLGIRLATPLTVKHGGLILNSNGLKNESQVWGKIADWCDYSGVIDNQPVGIALLPDPKNFRPSWFHARDYGLLVANPFGRNAFTKGDKSQVVVKPGESLRLRFGVFIHALPTDIPAVYRTWTEARP